MTSPFHSNQRGFTFLGVVLIVLMLAIFTTALYPGLISTDSAERTQITNEKSDLLKTALRKYKLDNGSAPASLADLVVATGTPCTIDAVTSSSTYRQLKGWCGPYIDQKVSTATDDYQTDGWGVAFQYNGVNFKSCGPDRTCGNSDDITYNF